MPFAMEGGELGGCFAGLGVVGGLTIAGFILGDREVGWS